ncbi:glycosyltransferase family 2 protein [Roseiconus lacunae]|uniref:glycosyltransferase family 2 protein n=1 Tax=Roseiconus lacunae TaxID=2605694 RepID=UPI001E2CD62C|nr:glycosyltransferase family 2 protein [Roseiconus lacunae]
MNHPSPATASQTNVSSSESNSADIAPVIQRISDTLGDVDQRLDQIDRSDYAFDVSLIIPVFNERQTLPDVLARIDEVMPESTETIIVDDASTDGTSVWLASLPERPNRKIVRRVRNHGKGSAVRLGIRHSRGRVVAIQDADSEYDPKDLLTVIEPVLRGDAEVVYGSRYLEDIEDPSLLHRLGNWALTVTSNCMTGQSLTDMETCHKAFRGDLVRSIAIRECRFGFEPEITSKVAARGVQISEVPTGYNYRSYDEGKKITWRDGLAAFACMWRYRNPGWCGRAIGCFTGRSQSRDSATPLSTSNQ